MYIYLGNIFVARTITTSTIMTSITTQGIGNQQLFIRLTIVYCTTYVIYTII